MVEHVRRTRHTTRDCFCLHHHTRLVLLASFLTAIHLRVPRSVTSTAALGGSFPRPRWIEGRLWQADHLMCLSMCTHACLLVHLFPVSQMEKMKNNAIVGNIGHFDNEGPYFIDIACA
jgi:hypothetical protein